jgi:hypothetical protein
VAAIAVVMAAVIAAVAAEAHAAAGVPALTDTTNSFSNSIARPDLPDELFFGINPNRNSPVLTSPEFSVTRGIAPSQLFR